MISIFKSLMDHQGFMKYFKNTSWLFGEKVLRMIVGLFVGVWVARYLGPEQFGLLSYAQSFVGLFTAIATLGLDSIVVRELVKGEKRKEELIGTTFVLKVFGALTVLFILAIAINFTSNDRYTNTLVFIIASATIFQSFNVVDLYFQSQVMSKFVVYANMISLFISSIVKIILILNDAPLVAFAWIILFDSFILACGLIFFYLKNNLNFKFQTLKIKREVIISLLKDSWPLILSGIAISIYMKIDQVMIKEMLDTEAVGKYAAAAKLSAVWYFIPGVIVTSLFPSIINAKTISEKLYFARLQMLFRLMIWISIVISVPITFLSDEIINLLYGEQYSGSGNILMIHIWASIFVFLGGSVRQYLIVENLAKIQLIRTFYGLIVNIILNYILIDMYGIDGAAIATVISYSIVAFFSLLLFEKTRKIVNLILKSFFWSKNE